jgi:hypothetical protein
VAPTGFTNLAPTAGLGPAVAIGGAAAGRGGLAGPGVVAIPSATNPLRSYYNNFWQAGIIPPGGATATGSFSSAALGGFGQPLYGAAPAAAAVTGMASMSQGGAGFTSIGTPRTPPYVTALSPDFPRPRRSARQLRLQLRAVLDRSSALQGAGVIRLAVKNGRIIVRGQVRNERDRRLAEALIRMTPGVQDVQNELRVPTTGTSLSRRF